MGKHRWQRGLVAAGSQIFSESLPASDAGARSEQSGAASDAVVGVGRRDDVAGLVDGARSEQSGTAHPRQFADSASRAVIEPDRDGADDLPEHEKQARLAVHTDREPADDFHLASQGRGHVMESPGRGI